MEKQKKVSTFIDYFYFFVYSAAMEQLSKL